MCSKTYPKFALTHVRHDPAHCLAPGLFRSLKKGDRSRLKLDVSYTFGDDSLRFWGPEPLGADDLRVLQGLIAMASTTNGFGMILSSSTESELGQQLRRDLELAGDAVEQNAMVAQGSFRQLARELGYADDGGSQFKSIRKCIERLYAVSIIVERDGRRRKGHRVLASYESDAGDKNNAGGQLFVAINPRLAEALVGERRHVRISMAEVRALKSDAARLIHQRLCGWIDGEAGKSGRVELDTLCSYVWPDATKNAHTTKTRRAKVRQALAELSDLGWTINEYARTKFEISRPPA
ncbi:replication protein C, IncQ-type [Thiomonas intermedia]|uniref:replication protein C, IncQ-type n=1 Tax=Thiomonas intermedia TaxID=926 RepID=UPI0009A4C184|nr:replication protein C, IncQ-type [Thiomonas intermedia]